MTTTTQPAACGLLASASDAARKRVLARMIACLASDTGITEAGFLGLWTTIDELFGFAAARTVMLATDATDGMFCFRSETSVSEVAARALAA